MNVKLSTRSAGSILLGLVILGSLPGMALAAEPAIANYNITGAVTAAAGGAPLVGIQVYASSIDLPFSTDAILTGADGTYSISVPGDDDYRVSFADPNHVYLVGNYDTGVATTDFNVGGNGFTNVTVGTSGDTTGIDVQMTVGAHITGKVTGPATPPNGLGGMSVYAEQSGNYDAQTATAGDGTYSLTVPSGSYSVSFDGGQIYQGGCYAAGFSTHFEGDCNGAVTVVSPADTTGIDAQLPFWEGDSMVVSPAETTVPAQSAQTYTVQLVGVARAGLAAESGAMPARPNGNITADVTGIATFTITGGGSCSGASCTPPAIGDYTVTATYGSLTATATIHATAALATPTPLATTPPNAPTLPPTSTTGSSGGGQGTPLYVVFLLGLFAAAATLALRRPIRR